MNRLIDYIFITKDAVKVAGERQTLPATDYRALPDFNGWSPTDDFWTCADFIVWFKAIETQYGTDAATMKFCAVWAEKPLAGFWTQDNVCGKDAAFVNYFASKKINVENPALTFNNYIKTFDSVSNVLFSPFALYLIIGIIAIIGLQKFMSTYFDVEVQKQKIQTTQNDRTKYIALGLVGFAGFYPILRYFMYKDVKGYKEGKGKGYSWAGVPLIYYVKVWEQCESLYKKNGHIVLEKYVTDAILARMQRDKVDIDYAYREEFNSIKDFLLLPSGNYLKPITQ